MGPNEWPMRSILMGHLWTATDGDHEDLQQVATWGPHVLPDECPCGAHMGTQIAKSHGPHK